MKRLHKIKLSFKSFIRAAAEYIQRVPSVKVSQNIQKGGNTLTNIQIQYWNAITNQGALTESVRHNKETERYTSLHYQTMDTETKRHNLETERQSMIGLQENQRHNIASEDIGQRQATASLMQASASQTQAKTAQYNAGTNRINAETQRILVGSQVDLNRANADLSRTEDYWYSVKTVGGIVTDTVKSAGPLIAAALA